MRLIAPKPLVKPGDVFGRLTVDGPAFYARTRKAGRLQYVVCSCECGNQFVGGVDKIKRGDTRSCGCYHIDQLRQAKNHGQARLQRYGGPHPLYLSWCSIKRRCLNPNQRSFSRYGGRGISICDEWKYSFGSFFAWAIGHGWKPDLEIDRIDNNRGYSPDNCRFVTRLQNAQNKRNNLNITAFGETKCLSEWSRDTRCVVSRNALRSRIVRGVNAESAMSNKRLEVAR